jgi:hypothetical protein
MAAYRRRSPPQMPMRKYIGTSETSKKRKKRKRSAAQKTPSTEVCNRRRRT